MVADTHTQLSLDPRPATRTDGIMDEYKESKIQSIRGYSTPYTKENSVQDRGIPLNRDLVSKKLTMAPSTSKTLSLQSTLEGSPRVSIPNPRVPAYNHIIPYQSVTQFGTCPCTEPQFQTTEHVWSNGTRVKGFDPRLA